MFGSFLITVREGLEAALVIGIVLAYLARSRNRQSFKLVWAGTALGALVSLAVGVVVYFVAGELKSPQEQIFEGSAMLLAVSMLTWMIFWMRRQSVNIKSDLRAQVKSAITGGSSLALVTMVFLAVVREGIETVLFLFAAVTTSGSRLAFTTGGILGLLAAGLLGYAIYKGTYRFNLRRFFSITSVALIFFAAGLLASGIHEFIEIGAMPSLIEHVWDMNGFIPGESTLGRFLTSLVGYNAAPSLTEIGSYMIYLAAVLGSYFFPNARRQAKLEPQNG
jgi:high-affinity iron transporter